MSKRDTYVVVTVDTAGIVKNYANEERLVVITDKRYVKFSDNRGDESGTGEKFTSRVDKSKSIIWIGIAEDKGVKVQIKKFNHIGGDEILKHNFVYNNGVLEGKIKDEHQIETERYSLTFQINGVGNEYEIDPQLEMIT